MTENRYENIPYMKEAMRETISQMTLMDKPLLEEVLRQAPAEERRRLLERIYSILQGETVVLEEAEAKRVFRDPYDGRPMALPGFARDTKGHGYTLDVCRGRLCKADLDWAVLPMMAYACVQHETLNVFGGGSYLVTDAKTMEKTGETIVEEGRFIRDFPLPPELSAFHPEGPQPFAQVCSASYRGADQQGDLMHDFQCADPDRMRIPELRQAVSRVKKTGAGRDRLAKSLMEQTAGELLMEKIRQERRKESTASFGKIRVVMTRPDGKRSVSCFLFFPDALAGTLDQILDEALRIATETMECREDGTDADNMPRIVAWVNGDLFGNGKPACTINAAAASKTGNAPLIPVQVEVINGTSDEHTGEMLVLNDAFRGFCQAQQPVEAMQRFFAGLGQVEKDRPDLKA